MKNYFFLFYFVSFLFSSPTIVSFTTTSERIDLCIPMINSILNQSISPDKFILNISLDPYPESTDQGFATKKIPKKILQYTKDELIEIHYVPNLGPFKKLGPVLKKYWDDKECKIITCDDDIIYPRNWLKLLLEESEKYPNNIIATALHLHEISENYITPFSLAPKIRFNRELKKPKYKTYTFHHLLTGYGILVKPKFFTKKILEFDKFLKLLPFEDDFFVSAELHNNKFSVTLTGIPHRHFSHIKIREKDKIWVTKHREGKIDRALYIMKNHFIFF